MIQREQVQISHLQLVNPPFRIDSWSTYYTKPGTDDPHKDYNTTFLRILISRFPSQPQWTVLCRSQDTVPPEQQDINFTPFITGPKVEPHPTNKNPNLLRNVVAKADGINCANHLLGLEDVIADVLLVPENLCIKFITIHGDNVNGLYGKSTKTLSINTGAFTSDDNYVLDYWKTATSKTMIHELCHAQQDYYANKINFGSRTWNHLVPEFVKITGHEWNPSHPESTFGWFYPDTGKYYRMYGTGLGKSFNKYDVSETGAEFCVAFASLNAGRDDIARKIKNSSRVLDRISEDNKAREWIMSYMLNPNLKPHPNILPSGSATPTNIQVTNMQRPTANSISFDISWDRPSASDISDLTDLGFKLDYDVVERGGSSGPGIDPTERVVSITNQQPTSATITIQHEQLEVYSWFRYRISIRPKLTKLNYPVAILLNEDVSVHITEEDTNAADTTPIQEEQAQTNEETQTQTQTQTQQPNGQNTQTTYHSNGEIKTQTTHHPNGRVKSIVTFYGDGSTRRWEEYRTNGHREWTQYYDVYGRLTRTARFDINGNLTTPAFRTISLAPSNSKYTLKNVLARNIRGCSTDILGMEGILNNLIVPMHLCIEYYDRDSNIIGAGNYGGLGAFDNGILQNRKYLNEPERTKSILVHELCHATQRYYHDYTTTDRYWRETPVARELIDIVGFEVVQDFPPKWQLPNNSPYKRIYGGRGDNPSPIELGAEICLFFIYPQGAFLGDQYDRQVIESVLNNTRLRNWFNKYHRDVASFTIKPLIIQKAQAIAEHERKGGWVVPYRNSLTYFIDVGDIEKTEHYYSNGVLREEHIYKNAPLDRNTPDVPTEKRSYDSNGRLIRTRYYFYHKGTINTKRITEYNANGELIRTQYYDSRGVYERSGYPN